MNPIPYGKQNIDKKDIEEVVKTLNSDFLTQGPKVSEFENNFAEYVGSKYALSVSNATAALHLSIIALGVKRGDRVITTPITFAATANCIRFVGAEVWFADIDPNTYLLDLNSVEELVKSKPKGFFKGIIPVDFAGYPVNMEEYRKFADKYDLWIIEDSCHAPGGYFLDSKNQKNMCGNAVYSDVSVFSFHPVKHIACGEGGMITTNSDKIYNKIKLLRTHGITKNNNLFNSEGWVYEMVALGYNYRLTDIQCALGITQLEKNKEGLVRRNQIADNYIKAFKNKLKYQEKSNDIFHAYHLFVIEVEDRLSLYNHLKDMQIYAQIHYIPIHTFPYYKNIGYEDANLSNAEKYYSKCISLPMFPSLKSEEQIYIIKNVLEHIKK